MTLVITGWVEALPLRYDATAITMGSLAAAKQQTLLTARAARSTTVKICSVLPARWLSRSAWTSWTQVHLRLQSLTRSRNTVKRWWSVLNRLLGQVQALAYDDAQGRLLGKPGLRKATALVLGENILSCDTERSVRDRFSSYLVTGQRPGTDDDFGEATIAAIRQSTTDTGVTRYRPHTVQQSGTATTDSCKARCEFEARQRAAKTRETTTRFRAGGRATANCGGQIFLSLSTTR
jgi:prophage tail gpP-like protein